MSHSPIRRRCTAAAAAVAAATALAPAASAQDVAIESVLVTQAIRFFSTPLVGDNVAWVRVFVETPGTSAPVPDVDALVHVFVDGVEAEFSPLRSINGPITSPTNPQDDELNDHLNFWFVAPQSDNVDFRVVLNPYLRVDGDDLSNNIAVVNNQNFRCRGVEDLVYVPINYTIGGAGLPNEALTEPGVGDGFVRGIFKAGAWNYHRSPLGPLTWSQDINGSNNALLNTLRDIRTSQLPSAGYPIPTFVYGWLPGNPFSGNGQAIGIPGDVGFGNTQTSRFQRTFAHEIGHLFGEPHNGEESNTLSIDVEHHLRDPLNVDQIRDDELDVMVAGQVTNVAWVSNNTFRNAVDDPRLACNGLDAPEGVQRETMIRVSGEVNHVAGTVRLDPAIEFPMTLADPGRADGTVEVVLRGADGRELYRTRQAAGHTRACCADPNHIRDTSPLHVLVPAAPFGEEVARIEVIDVATGVEMAAIDRSPSAPEVTFFGASTVDAAGIASPFRRGQRFTELTTIQWDVADADGDATTAALFYSPDGEAWLPFRADLTGGAFDLDPDQMPRSNEGRLRLIVTDGLNSTIVETVEMSFLGGGSDPEVYIITPNQFQTVRSGAPMVLHGYAWDREDGTIADDIEWVSSVDGPIGTGRIFTVDDLSDGLHLISAFATDSDGNTIQTSKGIQISVRDATTPDLDRDGTVGFGDLLEILAAFGPCDDFCPGDLDLDGMVGFSDILELLAAWGS
jgi:hypothetical protein